MSRLYELTDEIKSLNDLVNDGECTQEQIADTLDALSGELEEKCINIAKVVKESEYNIKNIKEEIERLRAREKSANSKIDSLKNYLLVNMQKNDIKSIDWPIFKISIRKGSPVVSVTDESKIPDEFMDVIVVTKPNKNEIKKAFKNLEEGDEIPGVNVVTSDPSIQIK